jgi:hypothetical protein
MIFKQSFILILALLIVFAHSSELDKTYDVKKTNTTIIFDEKIQRERDDSVILKNIVIENKEHLPDSGVFDGDNDSKAAINVPFHKRRTRTMTLNAELVREQNDYPSKIVLNPI